MAREEYGIRQLLSHVDVTRHEPLSPEQLEVVVEIVTRRERMATTKCARHRELESCESLVDELMTNTRVSEQVLRAKFRAQLSPSRYLQVAPAKTSPTGQKELASAEYDVPPSDISLMNALGIDQHVGFADLMQQLATILKIHILTPQEIRQKRMDELAPAYHREAVARSVIAPEEQGVMAGDYAEYFSYLRNPEVRPSEVLDYYNRELGQAIDRVTDKRYEIPEAEMLLIISLWECAQAKYFTYTDTSMARLAAQEHQLKKLMAKALQIPQAKKAIDAFHQNSYMLLVARRLNALDREISIVEDDIELILARLDYYDTAIADLTARIANGPLTEDLLEQAIDGAAMSANSPDRQNIDVEISRIEGLAFGEAHTALSQQRLDHELERVLWLKQATVSPKVQAQRRLYEERHQLQLFKEYYNRLLTNARAQKETHQAEINRLVPPK